MRINFGGANAGVAKQLLDDTQIRAVLEQVCREAVPQHVRGHVALNSGASDTTLDSRHIV